MCGCMEIEVSGMRKVVLAADTSEGGQRAGGALQVLVRGAQETCSYLQVHVKKQASSSPPSLCYID